MEDRKEKLLALVAAAVGLAILLPYVQPIAPLFGLVLGLLAVVLVVGIATAAALLKPRGRYDLQALREVDEEARRREAYDSVPNVDVETVFCPVCGEAYDPKYSGCPNCLKHFR